MEPASSLPPHLRPAAMNVLRYLRIYHLRASFDKGCELLRENLEYDVAYSRARRDPRAWEAFINSAEGTNATRRSEFAQKYLPVEDRRVLVQAVIAGELSLDDLEVWLNAAHTERARPQVQQEDTAAPEAPDPPPLAATA